MREMSATYLASTTRRGSFMVVVSSPPPGLQTMGRMWIFWISSTRDNRLLGGWGCRWGGLSTTHCLTPCQDSRLDRVSSRRHNASMTNFEAATFDRRHALFYFIAWLVGLLVAVSELSPRLTGFGLGL